MKWESPLRGDQGRPTYLTSPSTPYILRPRVCETPALRPSSCEWASRLETSDRNSVQCSWHRGDGDLHAIHFLFLHVSKNLLVGLHVRHEVWFSDCRASFRQPGDCAFVPTLGLTAIFSTALARTVVARTVVAPTAVAPTAVAPTVVAPTAAIPAAITVQYVRYGERHCRVHKFCRRKHIRVLLHTTLLHGAAVLRLHRGLELFRLDSLASQRRAHVALIWNHIRRRWRSTLPVPCTERDDRACDHTKWNVVVFLFYEHPVLQGSHGPQHGVQSTHHRGHVTRLDA